MENLIQVNNAVLENLINNGMHNNFSGFDNSIVPFTFMGWFAGFFVGAKAGFTWAVLILYIVAMWIIFQKAKRPGWAAIVPFYGTIVYLDVVGRPWWWLLLMLIPIVNIPIFVITTHDLSVAFKRDAWFTVGLIFLPWIFAPILAFGKDKYIKPKH